MISLMRYLKRSSVSKRQILVLAFSNFPFVQFLASYEFGGWIFFLLFETKELIKSIMVAYPRFHRISTNKTTKFRATLEKYKS